MTEIGIDVRERAEEARAVASSAPREIRTMEQYNGAVEALRGVKQAQVDVKKLREGMTKPLDESLRQIRAFFRPYEDQLSDAESGLKRLIAEYQLEEDRQARERAATAEAARADLEAEAMRAAEEGRWEDAEEAQAERDAVADPVPRYKARDHRGRKPGAGISQSDRWRAEVVDLEALVLAVATGDAPVSYLQPSLPALNAAARAAKDQKLAPPGVQFTVTRTIAATGR